MSQTPQILAGLRETFALGKTRSFEWRHHQLLRLKAMIEENESEFFAALEADLGKSAFESRMTETGSVLNELRHTLKHLKKWMRPRRVSTPLSHQPGRSAIVAEPLGVVLIMAPWNYPFYLTATPLIGAIAAGNCAVLKPSEISSNTTSLLARLVPAYLDEQAIRVVEGGVEASTELLAERFDHVFFTGSEGVGKIVMAAAAKHLTPVTLELGGKSPCIIDTDCNLQIAARRVVWGKFLNAGQTCIAPDYVLVPDKIADEFVARLKASIADAFGPDPKTSPDYPRLVNEKHFGRVREMISGGTIAAGGETDRSTRYIAPTVLTGVDLGAAVMQEEIFGPVLPVIPYGSIEEAIGFINGRPKPLSLYLFSNSAHRRAQVLTRTSSGSVCINDTVMQVAVPDLPFGGVGASGMGAYHGRTTFDTFSHNKSVLTKSEWFDLPLRYPPFSKAKLKLLKLLQ